jgi:hypothetical protein
MSRSWDGFGGGPAWSLASTNCRDGMSPMARGAVMLASYRSHGGRLTSVAFLSARNYTVANVVIIAAGLVTAFPSAWRGQLCSSAVASL